MHVWAGAPLSQHRAVEMRKSQFSSAMGSRIKLTHQLRKTRAFTR